MKKSATKLLLIAAVATISVSAYAQTPGIDTKGTVGYVIDSRGVVVRSGKYGAPAGNDNLCWRDGYWTPALAIAECDPDLVKKEAAAPAIATPVVPVAAVKPSAEKITVAADALFDFDKAVLRDEGKAKLDEVADKSKALKIEAIIAVGHADRIGKAAYNQKLSERRAAAVKDYLVSKGIAADRIYTEGKGSTQPVTKPGECKGPKSKKVIACLQPDRRVNIEIIGTK